MTPIPITPDILAMLDSESPGFAEKCDGLAAQMIADGHDPGDPWAESARRLLSASIAYAVRHAKLAGD